jgi:SAM-dependent methyltransferase
MSDPNLSVGQAWDRHFQSGEVQLYYFSEGRPFLKKFLHAPFMQLPLRYAKLSRGSQVLEAGCGSGKFSFAFALLGHRVTALDFSVDILKNLEAAKTALEKDVGPLDVVTLQGDLENLDLPDNQFDLVMNEGVVEHWLDTTARRRVLETMVRVTKPGGTVAVIVPNGNHPDVNRWIKGHPAFLAAPPMVKYTTALLAADLAAVGLREVHLDGIYAWRTLGEWPHAYTLLRFLGSALDHALPLPHRARLKWGLHLIGMGRKA